MTKLRPAIDLSPAAEPGGRQSAGVRGGFTLVELLVVIAILAMLMALIVPTVMRARSSAYNAKVKAEADMLHMALMNYKNEYGSFPPADMRNWSDVSRHLQRIFPRIAPNELAAAQADLTRLSPAQALVFWLGGFYPNQQFPLTNNNQPGTRKKFYDFDETRLYAASPYAANTPQTFRPRGSSTDFEDKYPVYFTAHAQSGLPYVYFDSRCYDDETTGDTTYTARSLANGQESVAAPYFTSTQPANPLWTQRHVSPDTFQLIASGLDGHYGGGQGGVVPVSFPLAISNLPAAAGLIPHQDNITNFASGPLLDAAEALKKN